MAAMSGVMKSATSAVITAPKAAPMTTATARSTRLPRRMKLRNSLSMGISRSLDRRDSMSRARAGAGPDGLPGLGLPAARAPHRRGDVGAEHVAAGAVVQRPVLRAAGPPMAGGVARGGRDLGARRAGPGVGAGPPGGPRPELGLSE